MQMGVDLSAPQEVGWHVCVYADIVLFWDKQYLSCSVRIRRPRIGLPELPAATLDDSTITAATALHHTRKGYTFFVAPTRHGGPVIQPPSNCLGHPNSLFVFFVFCQCGVVSNVSFPDRSGPILNPYGLRQKPSCTRLNRRSSFSVEHRSSLTTWQRAIVQTDPIHRSTCKEPPTHLTHTLFSPIPMCT